MVEVIENGWYESTPVDWSVQRMKNIMLPRGDKSIDGSEELLSVTIHEGIIKRSEYLDEDEGTSRADSLIGYKVVSPTNLVNNIMKMSFRCLGVSKYEGIVSPAYSVFELDPLKIDSSYLNFLLRIDRYIAEYRKLSKGIQESRMRLYDDYFLAMKVIVPPLDEQKTISRYLDQKISQIDSLIEKTQKKISLLDEQRTSLINHYVTKGLDPNVELKESGVEWIGQIPKHWIVKRLKYVSSVELSSVDRHEHDDEKRVKICHYPDVYRNEYIDSTTLLPEGSCSDSEYEKFSLLKGDILLTKDSETPEDIGIPTLVLESLKDTVCGYHLAIIRMTSSDVCPEYIYRYIESENVKNYFYVSSSGITRFGLGKGSIENLWVLIPPNEEQIKVSNKISSLSLRTKKLSERLQNRIGLLKEYRQSLISSVVTGKIRVTEEMV
jgi:type I restriction enzyme, S subunit